MVRAALEGDVEGELDVELGGTRDEASKIRQRAQLGMNALVSALAIPDRPGTARIALVGLGAVVRAASLAAADRGDGWQIEHIEAHLCDVGQQALAVRERAVCVGRGRRRAWKHLIPGGVARSLTLDQQCQRRRARQRLGGWMPAGKLMQVRILS